jgi:hypothetical protein
MQFQIRKDADFTYFSVEESVVAVLSLILRSALHLDNRLNGPITKRAGNFPQPCYMRFEAHISWPAIQRARFTMNPAAR